MRRIAVTNQKGGVGKTTTVANLGTALANRGKRILLVDLDPQAHLTINFGLDPADQQTSIDQVLTDSVAVADAAVEVRPNLHLVPSHTDLVAAEAELIAVVGREVILRDALAGVADRFDFLLIDCPPSLGVLSLNALAAAEEVLIPLQPHFLGLQGLAKLLETISLVQTRINAHLRVGGVVLCLHEAGTRLANEVIENLQEFLAAARGSDTPWSQARLFETRVRRNIKLAECPSHGLTIFDYAPKSHGAEDYARLAAELLGELATPEPAEVEPATSSPAYPIPPHYPAAGPDGIADDRAAPTKAPEESLPVVAQADDQGSRPDPQPGPEPDRLSDAPDDATRHEWLDAAAVEPLSEPEERQEPEAQPESVTHLT
ncbi:MAG TPA: AAA family ATPase [Phycisphaerae bacterium]|nr:AAA family ATPase [Phycisphaerae bacterium]